VIAHVSGIPVEELVPLAGGTGGLLVVRAWLRMRFRAKMKR
jgi:alpha-beta hydrolase superfamily lysophospholipase